MVSHCSRETGLPCAKKLDGGFTFAFLLHDTVVQYCNQETTGTLIGIRYALCTIHLHHAHARFVSFHFNIESSCRDEIWPCGICQGEQLKDSDSHSLSELAEAK